MRCWQVVIECVYVCSTFFLFSTTSSSSSSSFCTIPVMLKLFEMRDGGNLSLFFSRSPKVARIRLIKSAHSGYNFHIRHNARARARTSEKERAKWWWWQHV